MNKVLGSRNTLQPADTERLLTRAQPTDTNVTFLSLSYAAWCVANETDKEVTFVSVDCARVKILSVSAGRKV